MSELARGSTDLAVVSRRGGPVLADGGSRSSSKLVSREGSFRVYYTDTSGAVPFKWEARPGTPKHPSAHAKAASLPPLTPPPSYLSPATTPSQKLLRSRRHNPPPGGLRLMAGLVPRLLLWKKHDPAHGKSSSSSPRSVLTSWAAASSSNSSSSSSESSGISSPSASPVRSCASSSRRTRRARSRFSSFSSTGTSSAVDDEEGEDDDVTCSRTRAPGSATALCLGGGWRKSGFSGCSANVVAVKRALMSVVRAHGSGAPAAAAAPRKLAASSC